MINKVIKTIQKNNLIKENDKIVVAVSGGPDSMCLLHILNTLKNNYRYSIYVAHVNHMIREEADEETEYVQQFCDNLKIPCFVKKVDVIKIANQEKIGTEEAGRKIRYDFFEEVLKQVNANKIAIAHNANDNAETVLMNIFRGTGTSGLKGIEPIRDDKFIRPLIECERQEIEQYCETNKLNPKIDKSNFENTYTRNKVRNIIIPEIKNECNPNIIHALNKLSVIAREENDFIQRYVQDVIENQLLITNKTSNEHKKESQCNTEQFKANKLENEIILDLKKFNALDNFVKSKVLLASVKKIFGTTEGIEKIHIDDIIILCSRNIGNKFLTPNKHLKVSVGKGRLNISKQPTE